MEVRRRHVHQDRSSSQVCTVTVIQSRPGGGLTYLVLLKRPRATHSRATSQLPAQSATGRPYGTLTRSQPHGRHSPRQGGMQGQGGRCVGQWSNKVTRVTTRQTDSRFKPNFNHRGAQCAQLAEPHTLRLTHFASRLCKRVWPPGHSPGTAPLPLRSCAVRNHAHPRHVHPMSHVRLTCAPSSPSC